MTNREFYTAVINENITEDVIKFASEGIAKLDERNAKRVAKNADAHADEKELIRSALTDEPQLASAIAVATGLTTAKVSGLLNKMDEVAITEIKVKGGKRKGYALV